MENRLRIKIKNNPNVGGVIRIVIDSTTHLFEFKQLRTTDHEVTIGETYKESRDNFIKALEIDINGSGDFSIKRIGSDSLDISGLSEFSGVMSFYILSYTHNFFDPEDLINENFIDFDLSSNIIDNHEILSRSSKIVFSNEFIKQHIVTVAIEMATLPTSGDVLSLEYMTNGETVLSHHITWSNYDDEDNVNIGSDIRSAMNNLYNNLVRFYSTPTLSFSFDGVGKVVIKLYSNITESDGIYNILLNDAGLNIHYDGITYSDFPDKSIFQIKNYIGDINVPSTVEDKYVIEKNIINADVNHTHIDISPLIRDDYKNDITKYFRDRGDIDDLTSGSPVSKSQKWLGQWVKVTTFNMLGDAELKKSFKYYYTLDGYINNYDDHHFQPFLTSRKSKIYHKHTISRIYFRTKGLLSLTEINENVTIDHTSYVENDYSKSDEYIGSIRVDDGNGDLKLIISHEYNGNVVNNELDIKFVDPCKYQSINLIFMNKWGVPESLAFYKKSVKKLKVKKEKYLKSNLDIAGHYNYNNHSDINYNINAKETWILSSDILSEDNVEQFEELLLSEYVWLSYADKSNLHQNITDESMLPKMIILPVNIINDNFTRKNSINDKTNIQYNIEVEISGYKINKKR